MDSVDEIELYSNLGYFVKNWMEDYHLTKEEALMILNELLGRIQRKENLFDPPPTFDS